MVHWAPWWCALASIPGHAPNDRFVVREPSSEAKVWWGPVNKAMEPERFASLQNRLLAYLQGKDLFVQDCFAGADPSYRLPIRVITETARHNLFARNMFIQAKAEELAGHAPQFTVINAPNFHAVPEVDGTQKLVLIGGTQHAREIKKSIFTVMNYFLPQQQDCPCIVRPTRGPKKMWPLCRAEPGSCQRPHR